MNCKPGEMAVLVNATFPENVGLIVEILSFHGEGFGFYDNWLCKPAWPSRGVYEDGGLFFNALDCVLRDADLRPIRPPKMPANETNDEELTA